MNRLDRVSPDQLLIVSFNRIKPIAGFTNKAAKE